MRQSLRSRNIRMRTIRFARADRRFNGMRLSGIIEWVRPTYNHVFSSLASADSLGLRQRIAAT
jgi:hypothetical protein